MYIHQNAGQHPDDLRGSLPTRRTRVHPATASIRTRAACQWIRPSCEPASRLQRRLPIRGSSASEKHATRIRRAASMTSRGGSSERGSAAADKVDAARVGVWLIIVLLIPRVVRMLY